MNIKKAALTTVTTSFKSKGVSVSFDQPPSWVLYNSTGKILLGGIATPNGSSWEAAFTISASYVVPGGEEELLIEFSAIGSNGKSYSKSKDLILQDLDDTYVSVGCLYNLVGSVPLNDFIFSDSPTLSSISCSIYDPLDNLVYTITDLSDPGYSKNTKYGYKYIIPLNRPLTSEQMLAFNSPFLAVIEYLVSSEDEPITEVHPIYPMSPRIAALCNSMKQYLDKAQLVEIDPSLQWSTQELVHYIQEALKYINGFGTDITYWGILDFPPALQSYLFAASAMVALNARYLAEGFNQFSFNGLNTTLDYDRRDTITYKIEELKNILDSGLAAMKKNIVAAGYPIGSTDTGGIVNTKVPIGTIGLQGSTVNNVLNNRTSTYKRFLGYR